MNKQYFSHDPDNGIEFHDNAESARESAAESLSDAAHAAQDSGWDDSEGYICWGEVLGRVETTERPLADNERGPDWLEGDIIRDAELVSYDGAQDHDDPQHQHPMSTPTDPEFAPVAVPPPSSCSAYNLARMFHETYERLAPAFGYETRRDTKTWNPDSRNGRLMAAVCAELIEEINKQLRQIAEMPEYDQDDAHRLRGMARAFLLQNNQDHDSPEHGGDSK